MKMKGKACFMNKIIDTLKIKDLLIHYPFVESFFNENHLPIAGNEDLTIPDLLASLSPDLIEDKAVDIGDLRENLKVYIEQMLDFLGDNRAHKIESITILGGCDKSGRPEPLREITIRSSELVAVVGPTGSGKSRLLADIEWLAKGDTPTKRKILINGEAPDGSRRFSTHNRLVAQLSQNMNFVMDVSVMEFLKMHGESRLIENPLEIAEQILTSANQLSGEPFHGDTPITALSGGQSRALMIADTALLSASPIVLIDEIENAGIDRKKAVNFLRDFDKIVLMSTHDPSLALLADKRIVIKNGGLEKLIHTSPEEKELLSQLDSMDKIVQNMRSQIRSGNRLNNFV